jgi:hypothetical protein
MHHQPLCRLDRVDTTAALVSVRSLCTTPRAAMRGEECTLCLEESELFRSLCCGGGFVVCFPCLVQCTACALCMQPMPAARLMAARQTEAALASLGVRVGGGPQPQAPPVQPQLWGAPPPEAPAVELSGGALATLLAPSVRPRLAAVTESRVEALPEVSLVGTDSWEDAVKPAKYVSPEACSARRKFKMKLCREWSEGTICHFGKCCSYAHGSSDYQICKRACKYPECMNGEACQLRHGPGTKVPDDYGAEFEPLPGRIVPRLV